MSVSPIMPSQIYRARKETARTLTLKLKSKKYPVSITLRPRLEYWNREVFLQVMQTLCNDKKWNYLIAIENENHMHIAIEYTNQCTSNVRKLIYKALEDVPEWRSVMSHDEQEVALKVKGHTDLDFLLGYLQKELKPENQYSNGYTKERLAEALEYYTEKRKKMVPPRKDEYLCASINMLFDAATIFCHKSDISTGNELYTIMELMVAEKAIPISLFNKWTKKLEGGWATLHSARPLETAKLYASNMTS